DRCIAAKLISPAHENVFHVFPFLTPKRDQLKAFLAENGVGTKIHYFRPPYLQPCYPEMNHLEFPIAKRIADEELSLPCNSSLNDEDIIRVSKLINQFLI
ncbi:MAG: L-glutamine:2-deoxy-scyllo-inosose aminotransferase, partial [Bacteroidota bacterium]